MSKKKHLKIKSIQRQDLSLSSKPTEDNKNLQLQEKSLSWQKWGTIIAGITLLITSLGIIYSSFLQNKSEQKSLNNNSIDNKILHQSLNTSIDTNDSHVSHKILQDANKIQTLPIIEVNSKDIKDIIFEEKKLILNFLLTILIKMIMMKVIMKNLV